MKVTNKIKIFEFKPEDFRLRMVDGLFIPSYAEDAVNRFIKTKDTVNVSTIDTGDYIHVLIHYTEPAE